MASAAEQLASNISLANFGKATELKKRIWFTLGALVLFRLLSHVPMPGIDPRALAALVDSQRGGVLDFVNTFTGGSLERMSIIALGVMPYITASIVVQLGATMYGPWQALKKEGESGRKKLNQYTRFLTVLLTAVQGYFIAVGLEGLGATQGIPAVVEPGITFRVAATISLVGGTLFLMWIGEQITARGIGNGMSILIFASVVAGLPAQMWAVQEESSLFIFGALIVLTLGVLVGIVIIENGQRRIPVQFAKRVVGRRMMGGQSTYIPLKVNQSGIVPIIFASSILFLPTLLANALNNDAITRFVDDWVVSQSSPLHILLYGLMIIGFAYFYTAIMFDPVKQADQIRKQGGFIPGVRPGPQTERYLSKILNRITLPGALFIAVIALLPSLLLVAADVRNFPFAGTTVLIAVGVALETMKQIDSQLMMRNYEGFLK